MRTAAPRQALPQRNKQSLPHKQPILLSQLSYTAHTNRPFSLRKRPVQTLQTAGLRPATRRFAGIDTAAVPFPRVHFRAAAATCGRKTWPCRYFLRILHIENEEQYKMKNEE